MIIKRRKEEFLSYLEDTSNLKGEASSLFIPEQEEEVSQLLEDFSQKGIPVTLSAGGTGTTGGRVPFEGVILSIEKLNRILDIDPGKKIVKAQAGVVLQDLEKELNRFKLSLRGLPTEPLAFSGGAVSTCASGLKSFKYSSIRNYVAGLKICFSDGNIIEFHRGKIFARKRKFDFTLKKKKFKFKLPSYTTLDIKSSAGYYVKENMDFIDLFIGQEGTLGCILEITLLVETMPLDYFDCLVFFDSQEDALNFVEELKDLRRKGEDYPCSVEFFDSNSLNLVKPFYSYLPEATCAVYIEQEVEFLHQQDKILDFWAEMIERHNSSLDKCWFAEDSSNREKLYEFRHKVPQQINEFLKAHHQIKMATDIAVPDRSFRKMFDFYQEKGRNSKIEFVNFGHIGDNHLHFNFLPRNEEEVFIAKGYIMEFIQKAISLGGTISAEHGVGKIKKPYLEIMYGSKHLEEMAELKKVFDPSCILGLDNIFSKEFLFKKR